MVTRLDMHVGQILDKLKQLGLDEKTLVMFTSDNGPHGEGGANPRYFNSSGGLRGMKRALYEGGIRVPMIARWPDKIQAGGGTEHVSAFWDVMPTLAELAGVDPPENIDGISFAPTLLGRPQRRHEYLYWEFHEQGGKQAVRKGKWKAIRLQVKRDPNGPLELYDLDSDPFENNNVASEYPGITAQMARIMKEAHVDSDVFLFGQSAYRGDRQAD
jgi:arylsulfatase A-like enzyme